MSLSVSIQKSFKGFKLEVEFETVGKPLGILGASGCGKSMTLKCIAGIETPDSGHISVNGRVLFDSEKHINLRPQQRHVGYLFQSYALFPNMTAAQNIGCGLGDKSGKQERVAEMLRRFQLDGLGGRYPHQLSGGQQQRTALARMLICSPEVVLLDEPFSALDVHLRELLQIQLANLLREQDDAVMVTHSRDEVYKLCPELLVMESGQVIAKGHTKEMFLSPKKMQVARLTGCKNISPAKKRGEYEVEAMDWGLTLRTAVPVGESVRHVGIRAHDFVPLYQDRPELANTVPVQVLDQSEDPFEWNILFAIDADPAPKQPLWWKFHKQAPKEIPSRLHIPPEHLLLLEDHTLSTSAD